MSQKQEAMRYDFPQMKILLLDDFKKKLDGAEDYFYNLIKLLRDKGHEVETFFSASGPKLGILGNILFKKPY